MRHAPNPFRKAACEIPAISAACPSVTSSATNRPIARCRAAAWGDKVASTDSGKVNCMPITWTLCHPVASRFQKGVHIRIKKIKIKIRIRNKKTGASHFLGAVQSFCGHALIDTPCQRCFRREGRCNCFSGFQREKPLETVFPPVPALDHPVETGCQ